VATAAEAHQTARVAVEAVAEADPTGAATVAIVAVTVAATVVTVAIVAIVATVATVVNAGTVVTVVTAEAGVDGVVVDVEGDSTVVDRARVHQPRREASLETLDSFPIPVFSDTLSFPQLIGSK